MRFFVGCSAVLFYFLSLKVFVFFWLGGFCCSSLIHRQNVAQLQGSSFFCTNFLAFEFSPVVGGVQDGQRSRYTKKWRNLTQCGQLIFYLVIEFTLRTTAKKSKLMSHVGSVERWRNKVTLNTTTHNPPPVNSEVPLWCLVECCTFQARGDCLPGPASTVCVCWLHCSTQTLSLSSILSYCVVVHLFAFDGNVALFSFLFSLFLFSLPPPGTHGKVGKRETRTLTKCVEEEGRREKEKRRLPTSHHPIPRCVYRYTPRLPGLPWGAIFLALANLNGPSSSGEKKKKKKRIQYGTE